MRAFWRKVVKLVALARRNPAIVGSWLLLAIALCLFAWILVGIVLGPTDTTYKDFSQALAEKRVVSVEFNDTQHNATVKLVGGKEKKLNFSPDFEDDIQTDLTKADVPFEVKPNAFSGISLTDVILLGTLVGVGIWYLNRHFGKGKLGGKSLRLTKIPETRFADVIGADEILEEGNQIVDCLKRPEHYRKLGVRPLTGVLLYGPPGTGKTLFARAIAGEAGVPFFETVGSAFDSSVYIGTGTSNVRALFDEARKHKVAIVFIDEIDAVGAKRGTEGDSGTKAFNQTLNQLLAEMDGFTSKDGPMIIVIGATNIPENLDPALTRPGRLTRKVGMPTPDRKARHKILDLYAKKLPNISADVDLEGLSRLTPGMSGADLSELVNQAGLTAQREVVAAEKVAAEAAGKEYVPSDEIKHEILPLHFTSALDSAEMGPARKSVQVAKRDRVTTRYHEAGHAIVAATLGLKPRKVTIVPRGKAGGVTWATAGEEELLTKAELLDRLRYYMGARAAERIQFGEEGYTTGAAHDLKQATELAEAMIRDYGMVESYRAQLPLTDGDPRTSLLHRLILNAENDAMGILQAQRPVLEALATALEEDETIEGDALDAILRPLYPMAA